MNLTGGETPERVQGLLVTAGFFSVVGVKPLLGRAFLSQEDQPGSNEVAILSYGLWQRRFGGDTHMVGKTVRLNGLPTTVVGVMAKGFDFPQTVQIWKPLAMTATQSQVRDSRTLDVVARLKPGVSIAEANAEIATINRRLQEAYPEADQGWTAHVMPLREFVQGNLTIDYTLMLMVGVAFVLLIACANVANLQFARGAARVREIAVRSALGATRWRMVRQLLTEGVLLGLAGGVVSLLLAAWGIGLTVSSMPADVAKLIPGWNTIGLDHSALAFTFIVAAWSGILAGIAPALRCSKPVLNEELKEGGRGSTAGASHLRLRNVLVIAQIALALILLVGAGLMVKGFRGMVRSGQGYAPGSLLSFRVDLSGSRYHNPDGRALFFRQVLQKLKVLPGVLGASIYTTCPLSNNGTEWADFTIQGRPSPRPGQYPRATVQTVSPGFLRTMQIPLRAGRAFNGQDTEDSQPVALISQKLARLYWPHESPLGKRLRTGKSDSAGPWMTIVGVVDNVLYDWTDGAPEPVIYRPFTQAPPLDSFIGLRTGADPRSLAGPTRKVVASADPDLPVYEIKSLGEEIHESVVGLAYVAGLMGILGLMAFVLASVGIYGLMTYSVSERTHEIGIRMALGADVRQVTKMVVRRGVVLTLAGLVIGLPLAIVLARLLAGLVFGTSSLDVMVFAGIPALLAAVSVAACYIPARRAAKVDPMVALRSE
ncbi:MAG: ABC transporter permease, partial [Terriglobia bacterium]